MLQFACSEHFEKHPFWALLTQSLKAGYGYNRTSSMTEISAALHLLITPLSFSILLSPSVSFHEKSGLKGHSQLSIRIQIKRKKRKTGKKRGMGMVCKEWMGVNSSWPDLLIGPFFFLPSSTLSTAPHLNHNLFFSLSLSGIAVTHSLLITPLLVRYCTSVQSSHSVFLCLALSLFLASSPKYSNQSIRNKGRKKEKHG